MYFGSIQKLYNQEFQNSALSSWLQNTYQHQFTSQRVKGPLPLTVFILLKINQQNVLFYHNLPSDGSRNYHRWEMSPPSSIRKLLKPTICWSVVWGNSFLVRKKTTFPCPCRWESTRRLVGPFSRWGRFAQRPILALMGRLGMEI